LHERPGSEDLDHSFVDWPRFSGEGLAQSAAIFSN
jgi:hypothetical protein